MIPFEYILLAAAVLLILSILASKVSGRLGVPSLLIFLGVGMLAGSDGPGGIHFDDAYLAQSLGVVALVFILFSGGLDTAWESVRHVLAKAVSLSTLGVLVTAALVGAFAATALGFSALEGLLLGATGWVSGLTSAFPQESVALVAAANRGDWEEARRIYRWFMPLLHLDAEHDLVQSIKLAEQIMGRGSERVRMPRMPLTGARRAEVIAMVEEAARTRPLAAEHPPTSLVPSGIC